MIVTKKYLFQNRALFFLSATLTMIDGALSASMALLLKFTLDAATNQNLQQFQLACLSVAIFLIVFSLISWCARRQRAQYLGYVVYALKEKVFSGLMNTSVQHFHERNTAEYISMLNNDVKLLETDYFETIFFILRNIIIMILSLAMMLAIHPIVALVAIVLSFLPMLIPKLFAGHLIREKENYSNKLGRYNVILKDILSGFGVIKGYSLEPRAAKIHQTASKEVEDKKVSSYLVKAGADVTTNFAAVGMQFSIYLLAGYFILQGQLSAGSTIAIVQLMNKVVHPVFDIVEKRNQMISVSSISSRLLETAASADTGETGIVLNKIQNEICLTNVNFQYSDSQFAISGISLLFEKGRKYAILGESGSGKSTILSLLMGHHREYEGSITLDGVEIRDIAASSLPPLYAPVAQDTFLFDDTLYHNITLFQPYPKEKVLQVVKTVGLETLMNRLDKGLASGISENGQNISGGEKQRIALARAILKGCEWIVLDEAMSSLDNETAAQLESLLLGLPGISCISVMHKINPALLKQYDQIFVFSAGQICQAGTYNELMEQQGYFSKLIKSTFAPE